MDNATEKNKDTNQNSENTSRSPLHDFEHKGSQAKATRIAELNGEWDAERTVMLNAAAISLAGAVLGAFVNKKWLILTAVGSAIMAEQALTGWSPPYGLFKKLGKRTRDEITRERYGLKAMKGDFKNSGDPSKVWDATE